MIVKKENLLVGAFALLCACVMPSLAAKNIAHDRPNIVIVLADDIGFSDFGCFGGEIQTPNIDQLAANGIRFTNFATENKCGPSRASLQTGRYHIHDYSSSESIDIAEGLSAGGYKSYVSGKWSPGHNTAGAPLNRGYDRFFGFIHGARSQFAPLELLRDGKNAEEEWKTNKDFYLTHAISDTAVDYIEETPKDKPLFLLVTYNAPHWPIHALPQDIKKYEGVYAEGWDVLREKRLIRMKEIGIVPQDTPLPPRNPNGKAWEGVPNKAWEQSRMEAYAAMIDSMDQGVGRIVDALKNNGRYDNTLLIVTADNGASNEEMKPGRVPRNKREHFNEKTRDGRPVRRGNIPSLAPGAEDTWQSYGANWAFLSSTPFRRYKAYAHRGAHSEPLVVHWPKVIEQGGRISDEYCHIIDLLPTVLDAAQVKYPEKYKGRKLSPPDGKSLLPILRGEEWEGHDALYWGLCLYGDAVKQGKWKLVRERKNPWELYDLEADHSELKNLALEYPEKVQSLKKAWGVWRDSAPKQ